MQLAHIEWLENIATQLLTVLARDRFGDFVSDQVVAPVRESTAMALGHLIKLMPNQDLILAIINVLIAFADHSAWECRHGAFLGTYFYTERPRKFKKFQAKKLVKSNKYISQNLFFTIFHEN